MKKLFLILAVVLLLPVLAAAQNSTTLRISADVSSGTNLARGEALQCKGYLFTNTTDPWSGGACERKGMISLLDFKELSTKLKKPDGTDDVGAGCFYSPDFFIVYLYPDAWGGKGYELKQASATFPAQIADSVIMTPVYSPDDKFNATGPGQGILDQPGEDDGVPVLAKNGGLILKSKRGRIVRAQYSIPPIPAGGGNWGVIGWKPINMTTTLPNKYGSDTITISITEWQ
jgi:hypothetical protein